MVCSHPEALSPIPDKDKANTSIHFFRRRSNLESFKDILKFEERHDSGYRMVTDNKVQTKRHLLSAIAQVYDPLGLTASATF